jgi:hypothetical protein
MILPHRLLRAALFFALAASLAACSGSRPEPVDPLPEPEPEPEREVVLADYEDFDPAPYEDDPADTYPAVRHDVPTALMEASGSGIEAPREMQGFRVQVFSSRDKASVDEQYDAALAWYRSLEEPPASLEQGMNAHIIFRQPLYRLRLGDFATRQEAEAARQIILQRYPDAFIVPDRVTVQ